MEDLNQNILEIVDKNFVFIDKVWFLDVSRTKRERSLIGTSPHIFVIAIRSRNIFVNAVMHNPGIVDYKIRDKPVNGEDFKEFLFKKFG